MRQFVLGIDRRQLPAQRPVVEGAIIAASAAIRPRSVEIK
jgi:hypothetical protein